MQFLDNARQVAASISAILALLGLDFFLIRLNDG